MGYGCTSAHTFQSEENFVIAPGITMKLATAEGKYNKFKRDLLSSSHFNRLLHTFSFSYYYKKVERGMPVNLPINYYLFPTTRLSHYSLARHFFLCCYRVNRVTTNTKGALTVTANRLNQCMNTFHLEYEPAQRLEP